MSHKISIIIPFLNEETNLTILYNEIEKELKDISHELVFIDDGSTDNSYKEISDLTQSAKNVILLKHEIRQGKGEALKKGIAASSGEIIVFMDADLQDNPADLSKFLEKIDEGYDLVNGWRSTRRDKMDKTLPSKIGNKILWHWLLQTKLHDMNCGFKAFRRNVLEKFHFYGDNYRFIPFMAEKKGYKVTEVEVQHRSRTHGKSKYKAMRMFYGVIDTLTQFFIFKYAQKPFHFFGALGALITALGILIASWLTFEWFFYGEALSRRPLLLFAMLLIIIGIQFFLTGIVSELVVYLSHSNEEKKH